MMLSRDMVLVYVMVLACVMVLAHVMVLARVMVLACVMLLARVMVLACAMVGPSGRASGPEIGHRRGPRLLVEDNDN